MRTKLTTHQLAEIDLSLGQLDRESLAMVIMIAATRLRAEDSLMTVLANDVQKTSLIIFPASATAKAVQDYLMETGCDRV